MSAEWVWTRARERAALSNSAFTSLGRSAAIFPTSRFHPWFPPPGTRSAARALRPRGANPGDAPARQEVDIPDDYFISDDDLVDDEEPTRQDDEDDLF